jgi:hypothetical protein
MDSDPSGVIAGLDPAIHPFELKNFFMMDARVKPGHDESELPRLGMTPLRSPARFADASRPRIKSGAGSPPFRGSMKKTMRVRSV